MYLEWCYMRFVFKIRLCLKWSFLTNPIDVARISVYLKLFSIFSTLFITVYATFL